MQQQQSFHPNEVVWAKVTGYPWWPAQVPTEGRRLRSARPANCRSTPAGSRCSSSATIHSIVLVDANVSAYLSAQKLLKYRPHYDLFGGKATTNRRLRDAIDLADLCDDLPR